MSKSYAEICPCKDCTKRTAECHSKCEEYKDWTESGKEIVKPNPFRTIAHEKAFEQKRHRGK